MEKSEQKGPPTERQKPRRSRPSLGALSSLVSFDDPEVEDPKRDRETELRNDVPVVTKVASTHQEDHAFTRIWSPQYPPSTLVKKGSPSLRQTLSQDWLKTSFSPRPGKEPKKDTLWGSACVRPQRVLSNIPSLQSIPEENELNRDEGSELSDDNVPPDAVPRPTTSSGKSVADHKKPVNMESAAGSDPSSRS